MSRTLAARLTTAAMLFLLAFGTRGGMVLGSWLNSAFLASQAALPHEEEEERHAAKGATTHSGRRAHQPVSPPVADASAALPTRPVSDPAPQSAHTPTHRDSDLRNGLGTCLRC